jgi:hypothetical protein
MQAKFNKLFRNEVQSFVLYIFIIILLDGKDRQKNTGDKKPTASTGLGGHCGLLTFGSGNNHRATGITINIYRRSQHIQKSVGHQ